MKNRILRIFTLLCIAATVCSCNEAKHTEAYRPDSVYMIGASIAYPENGWFEMGCEQLGLLPINRAISGESVGDSAVRMHDGTQYTTEELDRFGVLVVMHVHNRDVCDEKELEEDYRNYEISKTMNSTKAFDYIIRKYMDDCRALATNPASRWYKVKGGKPVHIMLCTYWHDARETYNVSVRKLAKRWGGDCVALCAFDENIGFTKDKPAADGTQVSLQFAQNGYGDTEVIDGTTYGWHPTRGKDAEIQQRMARIFADAMREAVPQE